MKKLDEISTSIPDSVRDCGRAVVNGVKGGSNSGAGDPHNNSVGLILE